MDLLMDDIPTLYCLSRVADSEGQQNQDQKLDSRRAESKVKGQNPERKWVSLRRLLRGSDRRRALEQNEQLDGVKNTGPEFWPRILPQFRSFFYTPTG